MYALLSFLLFLTPQPTLGPIYEEIKLTDELVIRAEYLPIGAKTEHEGMMLTVEDFIVISGELEFSGLACTSRIDALSEGHKHQIDEMMQRCERQYSSISLELEDSKTRISELDKSLKSAQSWNSFYSWVTIGLTSVLVGTGVYIILDK
jgi:hypothetical protein